MYPWQVFKLSVFPPRPSFSSSSLQSQIPRTHSPVSRLQLHTAKEIASVSPSTIIGNYTARACRDAIHLKVNIMFMTRRRPRESKLSARSPAGPVCWHWLDRLSLLLSSVTHAWMQTASNVLYVCPLLRTEPTEAKLESERGWTVFSTTSHWTVEQKQHPRPLISSLSLILKGKMC